MRAMRQKQQKAELPAAVVAAPAGPREVVTELAPRESGEPFWMIVTDAVHVRAESPLAAGSYLELQLERAQMPATDAEQERVIFHLTGGGFHAVSGDGDGIYMEVENDLMAPLAAVLTAAVEAAVRRGILPTYRDARSGEGSR